MRETFASGGVMMWPLLLIGLGIVAMTIHTMIAARRGVPHEPVERGRESILFWGAMAAVLGVLGTLVGLIEMAGAVERIGASISPAVVWSGVGVALVTTIFGLLLFILALLCWYGLRSVASGATLVVAAGARLDG